MFLQRREQEENSSRRNSFVHGNRVSEGAERERESTTTVREEPVQSIKDLRGSHSLSPSDACHACVKNESVNESLFFISCVSLCRIENEKLLSFSVGEVDRSLCRVFTLSASKQIEKKKKK